MFSVSIAPADPSTQFETRMIALILARMIVRMRVARLNGHLHHGQRAVGVVITYLVIRHGIAPWLANVTFDNGITNGLWRRGAL